LYKIFLNYIEPLAFSAPSGTKELTTMVGDYPGYGTFDEPTNVVHAWVKYIKKMEEDKYSYVCMFQLAKGIFPRATVKWQTA